MSPPPSTCDIRMIGSGNAGFSAALSATQPNPTVHIMIIGKGQATLAGGNIYFTAGAFHTTHRGLSDLLPLVNNAPPELAGRIDIPTLSFSRQAYEVDGRFKFWGGLALRTEDGGKGLVQVFFNTAANALLTDPQTGTITGVEAVRVTSGITFTFGGLAVNPETAAMVSGTTGAEVPGLYCVGEMLGGIFYDNYPGGSGLTSGTVFGRWAGRTAAEGVAYEE
ncbi:hypothetical protein N7448_001144 [Penicillium atrosanguineum]|uniref:FAD-dependent oxidoreductase 2 FAD-binding domain-containing protein n=1 Tax=Penicillium atrosanguineum TaxID=1132637 RepID=A0A9W9U804_9EURO|nr:uncharacterized protein N7443_004542 [Penicillium atrosanguineum]KAJ5133836.1 hypothetical protein N7526_005201 [Penicillium atrosanguineum]KAJ5149566.1 hypothetical protein N7448_001144 [Penicillium atrosanguineum]KAJ5304882.1 hypothetical protein N7443_004542 [Penicillium atrosanguineum]KAJ5324346.1 hypothetical protein N7476_002946 [Penicillium atrosanguineum]